MTVATPFTSSSAPTAPAKPSAALELRGITKRFGAHTALEDFTLSVPRGSRTGIIGRSGAGKSTLVRLLSGLDTPDSGELYLGGENLLTLSPAQRRQRQARTGLVFQHFNLLAQRTAVQNVALPLEFAGVPRARREALAREGLAQVGLEGFGDRYPAQLSGGQKQRVGIARALVTNPELLLADEATSALDPETSASILNLLTRIQQERDLTLIIVTHQMEVVRSATTHVAVLDHGRLVESGETGRVLASPQHITTRALLGAHQPQVALAPGESLRQLTLPALDAAALAQLAALGGRVVEAQPTVIGGREQVLVWLAAPEQLSLHDLYSQLHTRVQPTRPEVVA
ncbi:Phosphonate-transporting ATPase (plasmid) [Deinococcus proteolyticus MRP]|uniref:Phosphonate-transporting ATPase n=1 Tax=Deinococcus proteolyticus (strain ATCC 35074 / DSM 20540 / JCM 6276 / NBRC 101906 / NCIMB 13154 / VKM Ac-1939 / CCM 2703 / MRP) TaxID=693977 RepID=F0RPV3_DEIPM|nr:Phosphonate-transporting ATPase [Deinococcus proteolyticus MRP]